MTDDGMSVNVEHFAIWVSDLEATKAFYMDALGLGRSREFEVDGVTNLFLAGPDGTELQIKYDADRTESIDPAGVDHLAIQVDDLEATFRHMVEETSCTVRTEPKPGHGGGSTVAFIEDPDGYAIELAERHG